ncbi:MarC family protein [Hahella sp. HN01]|uniref:MarC family protein n=1 Tax=Hahella sp. HN01 TaxID=2847262 RepID=UPI001C1F0B5A|nr:MarC family protein [Hahella sp. HN01]MBU6955902.1 MarC family protein [Hahella sp. HN01]
MHEFIATFVFFFAVIDPVGTIPVYMAVTAGMTEPAKRRVAAKSITIATGVLVFFVIAGELILTSIDIPLSAFQVSGGIILFLFALTMIFGESKPEEEIKMINRESETATFPLAIPSIASPGAILAAVLLTENNRFELWEQFLTTAIMCLVLLITLILMLLSSFIHKFVGTLGTSIISRVMGMILAALAVTNILSGIQAFFSL